MNGRYSTPVFLNSKVVGQRKGLFEDLRRHDGRANRDKHASVQIDDTPCEHPKVDIRASSDGRAVGEVVGVDDVVTDAGMDGKRHANWR